jgi:hypothetical protein
MLRSFLCILSFLVAYAFVPSSCNILLVNSPFLLNSINRYKTMQLLQTFIVFHVFCSNVALAHLLWVAIETSSLFFQGRHGHTLYV